jgi:mono/diheme cytochrome c family protein
MKSIRRATSELYLLIVIGIAGTSLPIMGRENEIAQMDHARAQHTETGVFAKVPQKAQIRPNPLVNDPDAIAAGRKLFTQHCAQCHGEKAEGSKRAPNLHMAEVQNATPGAIFWVLSNGVVRQGMPVWSKLPEPQRWQITTYIKSLRPSSHESNMQDHAGSGMTKP